MKAGQAQVLAYVAKGVHIAIALPTPVFELYTQLDGSTSAAKKVVLFNTEHTVESPYGRNGGFTDADSTNAAGLNQCDRQLRAEEAADHRGCHPAGGSATDDGDFCYGCGAIHKVAPT